MASIKVPTILLPNKEISLEKWAVVECDQFVEQPDYWDTLKKSVKDSPSTLNMIIPEIHIKKANAKDYEKIFSTMEEYVNQNILISNNQNIILVERTLEEIVRKGIMVLIDLESYSTTDKEATIRPSENTTTYKKNICYNMRSSSLLEMPHVIMLIEDEKDIINYYSKMDNKKIYDFELNMNGGHLTGYNVKNQEELINELNELCNNSCEKNKPFMIVGDGNHTVLSSKEYWEELKRTLSENELKNHPARFLLVEVENICSNGVKLYPIHRILKNFSSEFFFELEQLEIFKKQILLKKNNYYYVDSINNDVDAFSIIEDIQSLIDNHIDKSNSEVTYVYDDLEFLNIVQENKDKIGIMMPTIMKNEIFDYISKKDRLPKKTFSLGKGKEKRYYLETRIIKKNRNL